MVNGKAYKIKAKVWIYPSMGGWHFVQVGKKESAQIKARYSIEARGFGSLPVTVTIGSTTWKTSIFPSKEGPYLLALKADVRKKEHIKEGDIITFTFQIRA